MNSRNVRRSQPLVVLGVVLGGWLVARAMLWSSPFSVASAGGGSAAQPAAPQHPAAIEESQPLETALDHLRIPKPNPGLAFPNSSWPQWAELPMMPDMPARIGSVPPGQTYLPMAPGRLPTDTPLPSPRFDTDEEPQPQPVPTGREAKPQRWRIDGWALLRQGSGFASSPATSRLSGYGGSQAGAMLRYRLGSGSRRAPFVYARATKALVSRGDAELGLGMGVRPVAAVPVTVQGELRISDTSTGTLVRPVVLAVTELPPWRISDRIEAEAYAQGGYIGGDYATPFADGQARIERRMATVGGAELRLGAGSWGGAQDGAARLDLGPTASVRFNIAEVPVRVSVDYRVRVAGDAEPGPGVALTFISGF